MKMWLLLGMGLVAAQLSACGGGGETRSAPAATTNTSLSAETLPLADLAAVSQSHASAELPVDYVNARAKWLAGDVHNYSFRYKEGGGYKFAAYAYQQVVVTAGRVASIDGVPMAEDDAAAQRLSIDNLFAELADAYTQARTPAGTFDIVGASFDEVLGFPVVIHSGRSDCCDQDHQLAIIDFEVRS